MRVTILIAFPSLGVITISRIDDLLHEITARFILIAIDVHLRYAAEQVVRVTHDVLVGADQEHREAIRLTWYEIMHRQVARRFAAHVPVDLAVGVVSG